MLNCLNDSDTENLAASCVYQLPVKFVLPEERLLIDGEELYIPATEYSHLKNACEAWRSLDIDKRLELADADLEQVLLIISKSDFIERPDITEEKQEVVLNNLLKQQV